MDSVDDVAFECPYCGESICILVDTNYERLEMVEDCSVCCRPIQLTMRFSGGELISLSAEAG
jgi:hypothetical protein